MPIIGRLMTTSIKLPIHIEAIMPQNRSGFLVMTSGPGWMPWMIMAPTINAITALDGMPRVSMGMNEVMALMVGAMIRSEEHTSELQSHSDLVCRLLLEKKKNFRRAPRR